MRVCDKCGEKANFIASVDHQIFDLCKKHHDELLLFLTNECEKPIPKANLTTGFVSNDVPEVERNHEKKRRGRPPKNLESIQ